MTVFAIVTVKSHPETVVVVKGNEAIGSGVTEAVIIGDSQPPPI